MTVTDRLRRTAANRPFAAAEAGLLAVVVVATVAFVALLLLSAPVVLLWAAVLALLAAATLLVLALVAHGLVDARRQLAADEGVTSDAVLWGLWRTGEVVIAAAFLLLAVSSTGVGAELASADPANEQAGTIGMALAFLLFLTLALEVALVGGVAVRLALTGGGDED